MLIEDLISRTREAIFDGRLPPGTKLNERDLAKIFSTSRTVVKQALIRLAEKNLVAIEPNRGAFVRRVSLEDAHALFDALIWFEVALIARVIDTLTPAQITALRVHTDAECEAHALGQQQRADDLGVEFHLMLSCFSGNDVIRDIHRELMQRQRSIYAAYKTDVDYRKLRDEHVALIDLLEAKGTKRAQRLLELHYRLVIKGYVCDSPVPAPDLFAVFGHERG